MRHRYLFAVAFFLLTAVLNLNAQTSSNDVPRIISYQGQLTTANGTAMNGMHQITATLYSDPHGTNSVWQGSYSAEITNGIINLSLGSGSNKLPDNSLLNQSLWIGVSVDEGEQMQPLTKLAAVPYALNVPDQSITMAKLAPDVVLGMGSSKNPTPQDILSDPCSSNNDGGVATNVVAGGCVNVADPVAGYATIGGGESNQSREEYSTIAGGYGNQATNFASSALSGYESNATGQYSTVVGGFYNQALSANYASIVGGSGNTISDGQYTFIGGGYGNGVSDNYSAIVGGKSNSTSNTSLYASIGGGYTNIVNGSYSTIPGGRNLTVGYSSFGFNAGSAAKDVSSSGSIAYFGDVDLWLGNDDNTARKLKFYEPSTSGTNFTSFAAQAQSADIPYILPAAQGAASSVLTNDGSGTLSWGAGGGSGWGLTGNASTSAPPNFLGTTDNQAFEIHVFDGDAANKGSRRVVRYEPNLTCPNIIAGFQSNSVTSGVEIATISGGGASGLINSIADVGGTIGGGDGNTVGDASDLNTSGQPFATVAGGTLNTASNVETTVSGGIGNTSSGLFSSIGGGEDNIMSGDDANSPGGRSLRGVSFAQTIIGCFNKSQGTSTRSSTVTADRLFIVGNGTASNARANAFEISNDGHAIVRGVNVSSITPAIEGSRTIDNTLIASGDITATGAITSGYGLTLVTAHGGGWYTITLNYVDPYSGAQVQIANGSQITATIVYPSDNCANVQVTPLTWVGGVNKFDVRTFDGTCTGTNEHFMFHVFGRP